MRNGGLFVAAGSERGARRLFTATLAIRDADGLFEVVHACRVQTPGELVDRLAARVGAALASAATVREGLDPLHPIVAALLGAGTAHTLAAEGDLHGGALLGDGDLHVMQRRG